MNIKCNNCDIKMIEKKNVVRNFSKDSDHRIRLVCKQCGFEKTILKEELT